MGSGIGIYSGLYQVTPLSQSIDIFIYTIGAFILMPWKKVEVSSHSPDPRTGPVLSEYSLLLLFTTLGASLLISSYDLISMYLSIELQSFAVYLLATIYRDSESSTAAGLKYFLLGGLSSCFILLGAGLIYSYTGLTNLESIYSLVSVFQVSELGSSLELSTAPSSGFLLGLIFIIIGFLFKIAASPFHNWAPDVYDEVPSIVTTWLTIMPKISIVIFLLELSTGLFTESVSIGLASGLGQTDLNLLKNLFLISSLLSLILGTVVGLSQYKIKRLLAYSTISHVGFLLLALSVNTESSTESLIFYIFQYSITNLNTFLILLVFGYSLNSYALSENGKTKSLDIKFISELKGQFISNPILSLSFAFCLFSMAGIPPFLGFFGKQQVLYSAITSGYFFISIIAILTSVISASYYFQIIKVIHFPSLDKNTTNVVAKEDSPVLDSNNIVPIQQSNSLNITNIHSMTISALTLTIVLFMLNPSLILNSTHLLALTIFNY